MSTIMFRPRAPKIPNKTPSHASQTTSPPPPASLHSSGSYQISNSSTLTLSDFDTDIRELQSHSSSLSINPPILCTSRHFCYLDFHYITNHPTSLPNASDHKKELHPTDSNCICICDRTRASWRATGETTAEILSRMVHITHRVLEDTIGAKRFEYTFTCLVCKYTDTYTPAPRLQKSPLQEKASSLHGESCTRCSRSTSKVKNGEGIKGLCGDCAIIRLYRFIAKHVEEFDIGVAEEKKMGVWGWLRGWLCMG